MRKYSKVKRRVTVASELQSDAILSHQFRCHTALRPARFLHRCACRQTILSMQLAEAKIRIRGNQSGSMIEHYQPTSRQTDGRTDGYRILPTDQQIDGWKDRRMDGQTDEKTRRARVPLGHGFESRNGRVFSTKVGILTHAMGL